jgi:hypothetical protein
MVLATYLSRIKIQLAAYGLRSLYLLTENSVNDPLRGLKTSCDKLKIFSIPSNRLI